jgi:two-component sensor histidine kinase
MARVHFPFSTHLTLPPGLQSLDRRTAASYERELRQHRTTESSLRKALARDQALLCEKDALIFQQELLNQECHHRLLNNLQMIVGLLLLQSRTEANPEVAARLSMAAQRVLAISRLHRHLHSMDCTETVEFRQYLDELCRDHSTMSMSEECPDRHIVVEGNDLRLPTRTAVPLGLIVNELVTNAIKHGRGPITVKLEPHAGGHALSVRNDGGDLPEGFDPAASTGLGMTLVSSLTAQIGGKLLIDRGDNNDGARFTVLIV